ncbi:hypothetical protein COB64_02585 [Candidatus Wolfebacteria bacterium]|nr:MAG: hypothetical protein COB64_02585 [Candidatus Wolfebacteria bacterium]
MRRNRHYHPKTVDEVLQQYLLFLSNDITPRLTDEEKLQNRYASTDTYTTFFDETNIVLSSWYRKNKLFKKFIQSLFYYNETHLTIHLEGADEKLIKSDLYYQRFERLQWGLSLCIVNKKHKSPYFDSSDVFTLSIEAYKRIERNGNVDVGCDLYLPLSYIPKKGKQKILDILFLLRKAETAIPYLLSNEKLKERIDQKRKIVYEL